MIKVVFKTERRSWGRVVQKIVEHPDANEARFESSTVVILRNEQPIVIIPRENVEQVIIDIPNMQS